MLPRKVLSHPGKHWHSFISVMKSKLLVQPKDRQLPFGEVRGAAFGGGGGGGQFSGFIRLCRGI